MATESKSLSLYIYPLAACAQMRILALGGSRFPRDAAIESEREMDERQRLFWEDIEEDFISRLTRIISSSNPKCFSVSNALSKTQESTAKHLRFYLENDTVTLRRSTLFEGCRTTQDAIRHHGYYVPPVPFGRALTYSLREIAPFQGHLRRSQKKRMVNN